MFSLFVENFLGKAFEGHTKGYFWMVVKAPNRFLFNKAMKKIMQIDEDAFHTLNGIPLERWSKHAYDSWVKSPYTTNNLCESFNKWINKLRDKPILTLVDGIR